MIFYKSSFYEFIFKKLNVAIFFTLHLYTYGMESDTLESVVANWNESEGGFFYHWEKAPDECLKKLYYFNSYDADLNNSKALTFYNFGLSPKRLEYLFLKMHLLYDKFLPGGFIGVDGPANYTKDNEIAPTLTVFKNAFSYEREVFIYCAILNFFYQNKLSLTTLHAICYGCQRLIYALHVLSSNDKRATSIKDLLGINQSTADGIMNSIKLCILQAPMLDPKYPTVQLTDRLMKSLGGKLIIPYNAAAAFMQFYRHNALSSEHLMYTALGAGLFWFSRHIGNLFSPLMLNLTFYEKKNDPKVLLYDIANNSPKKQFPNIKFALIWHALDPQVKPIAVQDLDLISTISDTIYALGSPKLDHANPTGDQIFFLNYVRKQVGAAYYEQAAAQGELIWDKVKLFHESRDWEGLKLYTESSVGL